MKRRLVVIAVLLLGCARTFDPGKARDEIDALIAGEYADRFRLTAGSETLDSVTVDTIPGISSGDTLLERWWRRTDPVGTVTDFSFAGDTAASVVVATELGGSLNFVLRHDTLALDRARYLVELASRRATFSRATPADSWRLREISWAEVVSATVVHPTVNIRKIEFNGTLFADTTLDHLWPLADIPHFQPGETVAVKLVTYQDTTAAAAVLYGPARTRFLPSGDDAHTWRARFTAPAIAGRYRLVVDLLKRKTFFDQDYPYDANRWVIDYQVK